MAEEPDVLQNKVHERKVLNKGIHDLYNDIKENQTQLEMIKKKISRNKNFDLTELVEENIKLKHPNVDSKYLMNKYTCTNIKQDKKKLDNSIKD